MDGVWEPDNPTKQNELEFKVVSVQCYRHGGQEFAGTDPFCIEASAAPILGTINVDATWIKVVEWNEREIITVDDSQTCVISHNTFDVTAKTLVGMDMKKPTAKGVLGVCKVFPDRQTYYLREKVDYSVYHEPVKK